MVQVVKRRRGLGTGGTSISLENLNQKLSPNFFGRCALISERESGQWQKFITVKRDHESEEKVLVEDASTNILRLMPENICKQR